MGSSQSGDARGYNGSSSVIPPPHPEFDAHLARFESLINFCNEELMQLTQCMNDANSKGSDRNAQIKTGGSCDEHAKRFSECNVRRTKRLSVVQNGCGALYQSYEACMKGNQLDPEVCIVTLDKLYSCAAEKIAAE
jgi:hypothetical protein